MTNIKLTFLWAYGSACQDPVHTEQPLLLADCAAQIQYMVMGLVNQTAGLGLTELQPPFHIYSFATKTQQCITHSEQLDSRVIHEALPEKYLAGENNLSL